MTPTLTLPEVPMPKQPSMADLLNSLLAPGKPQEAQRPPAPTLPAPPTPEAPQRPAPGRQRLRLSPRQTVEALTSGRQATREARGYAEVWYQALRKWRVFDGDTVRVSRGSSSASRMRVVGVGNWGGSAGAFGSYLAAEAMLSTPVGGLPVTRVALAITDQGSRELERIRAGQGPESLIHQNGRGWNGESARAYAAAVLALAAALGDEQARIHQSAL